MFAMQGALRFIFIPNSGLFGLTNFAEKSSLLEEDIN